MRLKYGFVCDFAGKSERGKAMLIGIFDAIQVEQDPTEFRPDGGRQFLPLCYVSFAIAGSTFEAGPHSVRIRFIDEDGNPVENGTDFTWPEVTLDSKLVGTELAYTFDCQLLPCPSPPWGSYEFEISVDGQRLGSIPFHIIPKLPVRE